MEYKLRSNDLSVTILSKGAEISSLVFKEIEYIWQADAAVWPRHTPVLFPIVGRLKDNTYHYQNKDYSLSQHGFARDKEFLMIHQTDSEIEFELEHDLETKKIYPFEFRLQIKYQIVDDVLICSYKVINPSDLGEVLFGIGAHPGFRVPLLESEKFTDYSLFFDPTRTFQISDLKDGLLSGTKKELKLTSGELKITKNLFDNDALVFEDRQINSICLKSNLSGKGVELKCEDWPYFGIWSKKGCQEFICLEPWHGITDSAMPYGEFKNKKGIIYLGPKEEFNCSYSVRIF